MRIGMLCGIAAYGIWGLFPLYWPFLRPSEPVEILAHRIVWCLVVVLVLLAAQRHWSWIRALRPKHLALLTLAALAISVNWGTYIYGVNSGQTIETSLGYFINPLISVIIGVVVFRERLRRLQWLAVGLGVVAVVALTLDYGRLPWIALTLACAFGTYGLLKKFANTPSAESLAVETAVLFLPGLAYVLFLQSEGTATFAHSGVLHTVLLAGGGLVTAVPLMLFNAAAIRIPLSRIGMLQYLAPMLQFLIGWLVQHEEMPASRWIGFVLVWVALVILTADGLRATTRRHAAPSPQATAEEAEQVEVAARPPQPVREIT